MTAPIPKGFGWVALRETEAVVRATRPHQSILEKTSAGEL